MLHPELFVMLVQIFQESGPRLDLGQGQQDNEAAFATSTPFAAQNTTGSKALGITSLIIMVKARIWTLAKQPVGIPRKEDFSCIEKEVTECKNGDVIVEAEYLSVDPYMCFMAKKVPFGTPMIGTQVSRNTAYFGLLEVCKPKAGETVLVNAAAGAVGSTVVQIAKLKECKVIAFAGSDEKVAWLKELGADHAYNYKTTSVTDCLSEAAPEKINCYFDNVGGKFTADALSHMADYGRVAVCGSISNYTNDDHSDPYCDPVVKAKKLHIEGLNVNRWSDWTQGLEQMKEWVLEGKIKYRETVYEGFEKMPEAFIGLFSGDNIGKAVVKA
ncbi:prostaglandin reductase 1 isoform X3 [Penaeus vannamei]|uniref:prostaglandin reductase 1 isoform X3 n=1 Tax=Penaeus vannamei TaxID=6689 RepID=UPI00387FA41E